MTPDSPDILLAKFGCKTPLWLELLDPAQGWGDEEATIVISDRVCTEQELSRRCAQPAERKAGALTDKKSLALGLWSSTMTSMVLLLASFLFPAIALAQADPSSDAAQEREQAPIPVGNSPRGRSAGSSDGGPPGLDRLLQLPSGFLEPNARSVAGAGEAEWQRRFTRAQKRLQSAVETLESTKLELDSVAGDGGSSQWSVAPPGQSGGANGATNSPLSFKLRQDLLRQREELDAAEKALKELRIEADLAGVPIGWRSGDSNKPIPRRIPEDPRLR